LKIAALCKKNGVRLMITAVPHYPQYAQTHLGQRTSPWSDRPHIVIGEAAKRAGVPYLNSHAALLRHVQGTPQRRFYYHKNMHFNPRGYALWAKAQLSFLLDPEHGLLPAALYR
jgi:lysophospholipase L1-like esterase